MMRTDETRSQRKITRGIKAIRLARTITITRSEDNICYSRIHSSKKKREAEAILS